MPQSWLGRAHGLVSGNVIVIGFLCSSISAAPLDGTGALPPGGQAQRWWKVGKFLLFQSGMEACKQSVRL